jgi:hypothetical protein
MPGGLQAIAGKTSTGGNSLSCTDCHSGETTSTYGLQVLAAKAMYYEGSGHYKGPRVFEPAGSAEMYIQEGSDALYCNGGGTSGCSQCHTDQGFVRFIDAGGWKASGNQLGATPADAPQASPPGCWTCHKPHETGDFSLRTQVAVTLVDGTTSFNGGMGNLCVSCHKSRTPPNAASTTTTITPTISATDIRTVATLVALGHVTFPATSTKPTIVQAWSSSTGPHHGPQADFLEGINNWKYPSMADYAPMQHLTGATDTCVTCHMYGFIDPDPTGRLGGNNQMGGHGWYLNSAVHGTATDVVAQCKTCHKTSGTGSAWPTVASATTFEKNGHTAAADWDNSAVTEDILLEINGLKKTLLGYFGNNANFLTVTYDYDPVTKKYSGYTLAAAGAGVAPVLAVPSGNYTPSGNADWHKDWQFNPFSAPGLDSAGTTQAQVALNLWQSQSFWNLKLFMEDRSRGIHNPKFAARILYDAIKNLNDNGAGLTLGGTRP